MSGRSATWLGSTNHTDSLGSNRSLRLNDTAGERSGLEKTLKVKAGDRISVEVYAKYFAPPEQKQLTKMIHTSLFLAPLALAGEGVKALATHYRT